ncbi:uncharacterized protein TRUGW13939_11040 [Talaromyces rugulosus]|uniref:Uncharacterized protein n=1 Tax=Talaromyces rugulosus TaxID=121627 RepID=A0A7H8RBN7_TALRU|nr:uncharacterized protein TRUGW13939_11040 [Talaromyces rugulosus]QKX63869.1 hypothetical protein TRUGW13939_11040 [Talaromyces rugulosus]
MRTYLLPLFSLAASALAQNYGTYVKTDNEDWYLALYPDDSNSEFINYVFCVYNSSVDPIVVSITDKKELYFPDFLFYFDSTDGSDTTLGGFSARQFQHKSSDKEEEEAAAIEKRHELKGDDNSTSGFSWTANGTLKFDYDGFYGWVKCDNFTVPHEGIAFGANNLYWAMEPIKDMPSYCEEVTLSEYSG